MKELIRFFYHIILYSRYYRFYLRLFRPSIFKEYQQENKFYKAFLHGTKSNAMAFDIGANVGDKSAIFLKYCRKVVAVEPDPSNFKILSKRFLFNRNFQVVNAAVSNGNGEALLHVIEPGCPANTLSTKWKGVLEDANLNRWSKAVTFGTGYSVKTITRDSLIAQHGKPGYVKIDVEGYEKEVLEGLSEGISIISLEAHFPDFKVETIPWVNRLNSISIDAIFNILCDQWKFTWREHKSAEFIIGWLSQTELKYFEMFCFTKLSS